MSALVLDDAAVRAATDFRELVDGIETALKEEGTGGVVVPPRMNLELSQTWLRVMPAIVPSAGVMGLKAFYGVPGHGVRYMITLFDVSDGSVLAILDAHYLTAARTAATSAVASRHLSSVRSIRLGVIGSGLEAQTHCQALATIKELTAIQVYSPRAERRQAFAKSMEELLGVPTQACEGPEDALASTSEVVVATNTGPSMAVACRGSWLSSPQLVMAIGSTNPRLRELDTDVLRRADTLVFDANPAQIAEESADVMAFCAEGGSLDAILTLPEVVAAASGLDGRWPSTGLTVFKSVGTGVQDVVAAAIVYRRAKELGLGIEIVDPCSSKVFVHSPS